MSRNDPLVNPLTELLRPYASELKNAMLNGDLGAKQVIDLYHLHFTCQSDPAAPALCQATFQEWLKNRGDNA